MKHTEEQVLEVNILSSICYLCKKCRGLFYHKDAAERHFLKCGNETERCISCNNDFSPEGISKEDSDNNNTILRLDSESSNCRSSKCSEAITPERKPFACTVCKASFSAVEQLFEHRITHSGPFICRACGSSFTRAWSLRRHLSSHFRHGVVSCNVCRKRFSRVDNLRKHCKVHFSDIKYICGVCGEQHEKKMCYKKYIIPPEDGISNQDMLQVGPLTSNIVKSKVSTELAASVNPMITLEKASPVKSSSLGEVENPGAALDDVTSNESNLDAFLGDSASELSSSSGGTVSPLDLEEDVLLGESPPPDDTASTADNMEEIMSGRCSSLLDLSFPSAPSEGSSHEKPSFHSEKADVNTSMESATLESSSSTDSGGEKGIPELPVLEEPYSNETSDQQPLIEGMLNVSSLSEIVAQEVFLEWESLDGTLFSSEAANPGTSLDAETSLERASSSDIVNPKGNWVGASLVEPSLGDTNPMAFLEEISQGVLHSMEIAYPENSREGELQERTLLQNESAVMEPPMECETNEMSSPSSGIGDSWDFLDWASLDNPPTEAADVWPFLEDSSLECSILSETEGTLVEGELLEGPPSSFESTDLWVLPNTRNDDSATTSESSSFERSPSPFDFISKEPSQRNTFENEFKSITEMNKSSHFSENAASLRDVDLELPVEMYHVGIEFQCCDLSSIFDDLEMNEMGNPIQTNTIGTGMNENSDALPPLGHASMKMIVNEVTNQLHEVGIYRRAESYVGVKSSYWDFSNESPGNYYLDSFDMLELF